MYVPLLLGRELGRDSKCLCPFHGEAEASLHAYGGDPPATIETVVLTRTGLHLQCWDHLDATWWRAFPQGARICSRCWPPAKAARR